MSTSPTYDATKAVYWFITVGKLEDWTFEKFRYEYTDVHAKMTAGVAEHVDALRDYTQVLADDIETTSKPTTTEGWHALTIHIWSNLLALHESFADPGYKASAGKHVFCRQDQNGCFAELVAEAISPAYVSNGGTTGSPKGRTILFHRRHDRTDDSLRDWLEDRLKHGQDWVESTPALLRYRQYVDVTPRTTDHFFAGTQFAGGVWQQFEAVEDLTFTNVDEASRFVSEHQAWLQASQTPLVITGQAFKVFGTD